MIKPFKEPTMTVTCKKCEYQYGAWRPHCPTCGQATPQKAVVAVERAKRPARPRKPRDECAFCRGRVKRAVTCPICNEKVHKSCMSLHEADCIQFQKDVAEATRRSA